MTIKLLVLKSGEELISDITEMAVGEEDDQKIVGYFLQRPCIVRTKNPGVIEKVDNKNTTGFEVTLIPWIPLSEESRIPCSADWVVTIVEPVKNVKKLYRESLNGRNQGNQSPVIVQSGDSSIGD